ncbi:MAG: MBL fold metallo-hydrolase [Oscillospiraceae bacterium]
MRVETMPLGMLGTNCYIVVNDQKNAVIIDPGAKPEKVIAKMDELGAVPKYILLTHGHFDHVGAVIALREHYGIQAGIGQLDSELTQDTTLVQTTLSIALAGEVFTSDIQFKDGDTITIDELTFRMIHTPGHTKGGMCIVCNDFIFTGDTLFKGTCGRTDLYGGDYKEILKSLQKLAQLAGDYKICPGHEEWSTLEYEKETNPYMGNVAI